MLKIVFTQLSMSKDLCASLKILYKVRYKITSEIFTTDFEQEVAKRIFCKMAQCISVPHGYLKTKACVLFISSLNAEIVRKMTFCCVSYRQTSCSKSIYDHYCNIVWSCIRITCSGSFLEEGNILQDYRANTVVYK